MYNERVKKFIKLVTELRANQNEYIKTKKKCNLIAAKKIGKEVDIALFELRQTELFNS
jgi:hypothetical protein